MRLVPDMTLLTVLIGLRVRVATGFIAGCLAVAVAGCAHRPVLQRHEFTSIQMAIPFRIVLYAADGTAATNAANAAWARIAALNRSLSDYDAESELSRFSAGSPHREWVPLSPDLARVLVVAQQLSAASDGGFDVTVGPLTQLWRRARRQHQLPDPELLATARAAVGWSALELKPAGPGTPALGRLLRPGMRLDLGAIAKGYALDAATEVLQAHGITRSLVAGAGDLVVTDPPPGQPGWKIDVAPLDFTNAPPTRHVWLRRASLCCSGDLVQHVEIGGVRYSHIVDPHTGLGLTDHSLVTVIGSDGMTTDALGTAISVVGPVRGLKLARRYHAETLIVRRPGDTVETVETPGFRRWENPGR